MRIALLADPIDDQRAGIHYYTKHLCQALINNPGDHEFVFIHQKENKFFEGTEHYIIPDYNKVPGWTSLRKFYLIRRLVKKLKVDAVWEPAHFGPFNLPSRIKRITTIHDLTPILFPQWHTFMTRFLHKIFLRRIVRNADQLIVPSNSTRRDLIAYEPTASNKIQVIPLATEFTGNEPTDKKLLTKHNIATPYFLFVGTIEPRKGLPTLLQAFHKVRTNHKCQLVIVGGHGWHETEILNQIKNAKFSKDIILTGYVPRKQLPTFYQHAHAFIFPSAYEGFGLPVLEAMTFGTPCLLTDNSSLPEVAGKSALYFRPNDHDTLANLMRQLLINPALKTNLQSSCEKQANKLSWDQHVKQLQL